MRILGIDPALNITGYGVVDYTKNDFTLVEAGVIKSSGNNGLPARLERIYQAMVKLISDTKPDTIVLEKIFSHYQYPATSYLLGHARGVICLAAQTKGVELVEYAATRIKKAIVGKGLASKQQVQSIILKTFGLKTLPKYTDVTDALALAIAHGYISRIKL
jgi:crossover junction endodeoxyribonuclease RuvC